MSDRKTANVDSVAAHVKALKTCLQNLSVELDVVKIPVEEYQRLRSRVEAHLREHGIADSEQLGMLPASLMLGGVKFLPDGEEAVDLDKPLSADDEFRRAVGKIVEVAVELQAKHQATVVYGICVHDGETSRIDMRYIGEFFVALGMLTQMPGAAHRQQAVATQQKLQGEQT